MPPLPYHEIDPDYLTQLHALAKAIAAYPWQWGHSNTATIEEAIAYQERSTRHSADPDLHLVFFEKEPEPGGDVEASMVCITGNGPTSPEAAQFITAAQPLQTIAIVENYRTMADTLNRLGDMLREVERNPADSAAAAERFRAWADEHIPFSAFTTGKGVA